MQLNRNLLPAHKYLALWLLLAAALLSLSCSAFTRLITGATPTPSTAKPVGLIAYVGTDGNIYTADSDGQNRSALTSDADLLPPAGQTQRIYQYPTWSFDGSRLAFVEISSSPGSGREAVLHTVSPNGQNPESVYTSQEYFPFYLYWSPDDQYVSFLSSDIGEDGLALHLVNAQGGEHRILDTGQPYYWDWSPGGSLLLTHTGGAVSVNPEARLVLLMLNDEVLDMPLDLHPTFFQAPAWSPSGEEIVLAAETEDAKQALLLVNQEGKLKQILLEVDVPVSFAWSPTGNQLAYLAPNRSDSSNLEKDLVVLDPAEPQNRRMLAQAPIVAFFWSPDGQKIAYFVLLPDNDSSTIPTSLQRSSILLGLSVVNIDGGDRQRLAIFEPTTSFTELLPFFDQYQRSTTLWSPDSQRLVIAAQTNGADPGIYAYNVDSAGLPIRIADGFVAFWSWK